MKNERQLAMESVEMMQLPIEAEAARFSSAASPAGANSIAVKYVRYIRYALLAFTITFTQPLPKLHATGGNEGTFEFAIDAPWRIEPYLVPDNTPNDDSDNPRSYGKIPIQITIHDANFAFYDCDARVCGWSETTRRDPNCNPGKGCSPHDSLGRLHEICVEEAGSGRTCFGPNELDEIEMTIGTWEAPEPIATRRRPRAAPPARHLCRQWNGDACADADYFDVGATNEWHGLLWYEPIQPECGEYINLQVTVYLRGKLTQAWETYPQTCFDGPPSPTFCTGSCQNLGPGPQEGGVSCCRNDCATPDSPADAVTRSVMYELQNHLFVYLANSPLPRFSNEWLYGDLHYHSQGSDNEGESAYNYRGVVRAMGAMGLDFVIASDHSSNSAQVVDADLDPEIFDIETDELNCLKNQVNIGGACVTINWKYDGCFHVQEGPYILRDLSPERFATAHDWIHGRDGANEQAAVFAYDGQVPQNYRSYRVFPQIVLGEEVNVVPEVAFVVDKRAECVGGRSHGRPCGSEADCPGVDDMEGTCTQMFPDFMCDPPGFLEPPVECFRCRGGDADGRPCQSDEDCPVKRRCIPPCGSFEFAKTELADLGALCGQYLNPYCQDIEIKSTGEVTGGPETSTCSKADIFLPVWEEEVCLLKDAQGKGPIDYFGSQHLVYFPASSELDYDPGQQVCNLLQFTGFLPNNPKPVPMYAEPERMSCDDCEARLVGPHDGCVFLDDESRDPTSRTFIASNLTRYGGASKRLKEVMAEAEGVGYLFAAHPFTKTSGIPGPDGIPWSTEMLKQAFASQTFLGLEFWNEGPHLRTQVRHSTGTRGFSDFEEGTDSGFDRDVSTFEDEERVLAEGAADFLSMDLGAVLPTNVMRAGFGYSVLGVFFPGVTGFKFEPFLNSKGKGPPVWDRSVSFELEDGLRIGLAVWDEMLRWGITSEETKELRWLNGQPRRVFVAAGSDAHGDFNYRRTGYFLHSTSVNDSAIGKPRNLVFVGPPAIRDFSHGGPDPTSKSTSPLGRTSTMAALGDIGEPTGACCLPHHGCQVDYTEEECGAQSGTWHGTGSTSCGFTCVTIPGELAGACCLDGGTCETGLSRSSCEGQGGTWQGATTTTCSNCNVVGPTPRGACCIEERCELGLTRASCSDQGGEWQGTGTLTCINCRGEKPTPPSCIADAEGPTPRPLFPARHSHLQVANAIKSGQFCATDGPIVRIAIDQGEMNRVIDDGDIQMGSVLHLDYTSPVFPNKPLPKIALLVEYQSTEEFGNVGCMCLFSGEASDGSPPRTYFRTADEANFDFEPLQVELDEASGLYHLEVDPGRWVISSHLPGHNMAAQAVQRSGTCDPMCEDLGGRHESGVWVEEIDLAEEACDGIRGSCDRFYFRVEVYTDPKADAAHCEHPEDDMAAVVGDCIQRRAFSNPIWVVVDRPLGPNIQPGVPTGVSPCMCGVGCTIPLLFVLASLGSIRLCRWCT